jgi:N-acetyl-alpha-D-muramate 1-phosphate uridylyltransferase
MSTRTDSELAPIRTAMLLAAGLGTRMRPLTAHTPKPLIPVAGRPMIDYLLGALDAAGVRDIVVNVHYLADQIEAHLKRWPSLTIQFSDERERLLDSGGGVKKALPLLGADPFLVLNADSFWIDGPASNLMRLISRFDPALMDILLLLAPTTTSVGWGNRGDFAFAADGRLRRPLHGEITPFAYAGVAIFRPECFADTPDVFSLNLLFDRAIARARFHGMRLDGLWMHVGTPAAIGEAERQIVRSVR